MFDKQTFPIEPAWIFNLSSISRWLAFEDSRHLWRRTPVLSARPTLLPVLGNQATRLQILNTSIISSLNSTRLTFPRKWAQCQLGGSSVYTKGQKVGPVVVFHLFAQPGVSRQVVDHRPAVCSRPGFYSYEDCQLSSKQLQTVKQALSLKNSLSF